MPDSFTKVGKSANLAEQERARAAAQAAAQAAAEEADRTGVVQPDIEEVARRRAEERTQAEMMQAGMRGPAAERVQGEGGYVRGRYQRPTRGPWSVEGRPSQEAALARRQVASTMQPGLTPEDARSMGLAPTAEEAQQQVQQLPQGPGLRTTTLAEDPALAAVVRRAMLLDPQLGQMLQGQAQSSALLRLESGTGNPAVPLAGIPPSELSAQDYEEMARGEDEPRRPPNNVYSHYINADALSHFPSVSDSPETVGATQEEFPAHEISEGVERGNAYGSDTSDVRTFVGTAHPEGILEQNRIRTAMGLPGGRVLREGDVELPGDRHDKIQYYAEGETHMIFQRLPGGGERLIQQYTVPTAAHATAARGR